MDTDSPAVVTDKIAVFCSLADKRSSNESVVDVRVNTLRGSVITDAGCNRADSVLSRPSENIDQAFPIGSPVSNPDVLKRLHAVGNLARPGLHRVDVDVDELPCGNLVW